MTTQIIISTPIIARTQREAREILSRTYRAEHYKLTRHAKISVGKETGWQFNIIPKKTADDDGWGLIEEVMGRVIQQDKEERRW